MTILKIKKLKKFQRSLYNIDSDFFFRRPEYKYNVILSVPIAIGRNKAEKSNINWS